MKINGKFLSDEAIEKQMKTYDEHRKKGIEAFWLINIRTGNLKVLELKKKDFPWIESSRFDSTGRDWKTEFRNRLVWEKDKNGEYKLIYPK